MALQDYITLKSDIYTILKEWGTPFKIVRAVNGTGTALGSISDKTIATNVYGTMDKQIRSYIPASNGGVIETGTKTIYLNPPDNNVVLEPGDRLISGKVTWRIISVELFRPDNQTLICYELSVT